MNFIRKNLAKSGLFFVFWCVIAAFGSYFSMYAFRKPFNTGLYATYELWGIGYKTILIITQVIGYMLSKFIGIKVIAEMKASGRIRLIISLILIAEGALLLFGLVPFPYNFVFLFFNGLPLGMVWGVVFSFLEGRKMTEFLALGLSLNLVMTSGVLKTIYLTIHEWLGISEFWMPAAIGLLFLPFFCFFVWMLSLIPPPTAEDISQRSERPPMNNDDKKLVVQQFGFGLFCFVMVYCLLAAMRDFRDNFSVEIWNEIDAHWNKNIFTQTESLVGLIVLSIIGLIALIKRNIVAFNTINAFMMLAILVCGGSTLLFQSHLIQPFYWMLCVGVGLFLPYLAIQTIVFERLIALFRVRANAGFLVYICDAIGYLGSVGLLLYREFFIKNVSWAKLLVNFSYAVTIICLLFLLAESYFFYKKARNTEIAEELAAVV